MYVILAISAYVLCQFVVVYTDDGTEIQAHGFAA